MANDNSRHIVVCPKCQYGFRETDASSTEFTCPRSECGHHWGAHGETIRAVHGAERRRAVFEVNIVAGATPARIELMTSDTVIGRDKECGVVLDSKTVSRRHAHVSIDGSRAWITDLASSCGTAVNGTFISSRTELFPGDELILGGTTLRLEVRFEAADAPKRVADNVPLLERGLKVDVQFRGQPTDVISLDAPRITFGRAPDRNVTLAGPLVSAKHAVIERERDGDYLSDVQSVYGTYINGKPIIKAKLVSGDRIQIGPFQFQYEGHRLVRTVRTTAISVSAVSLTLHVDEATLLDDLSFRFEPGEFVGVIGPSGSGKTTLLNALSGRRPATSGDVLMNGESLYEDYDRLRQNVGYVPQNDAMHSDLTVRQVLDYAARLRLPIDTTEEERNHIVQDTLESLDLTRLRDNVVDKLSAGQRRKLSAGVELLSRPSVLFLDEPTSGLDPGTESKLMKFFRRLADQGRTVVCKTHTMEHIDLFDKIVVLVRGGRLAYFGPPQDAKSYFGINRYIDLYERLDEHFPETWKSLFPESAQYQDLIAPLTKELRAAAGRQNAEPKASHGISGRRIPLHLPKRGSQGLAFAIRQCRTLIDRLIRSQLADRTTLIIQLVLPLVIAILICLVSSEVPTVDFLLVISAMWFGCSSAATQMVKERPIYRRERMVYLRLDAYLFSKLLPLMLLTAVQVMVMMLMAALFGDTEGSFMRRFLALLLVSWNGVATGLLISTVAATAEKAMAIVPLVMIPQIVLGGFLIAIPDMNPGTGVISRVVAARWATHACNVATLNGRPIVVELLLERNLKQLKNLYPAQSFRELEDRVHFLVENRGKSISKSYEYRESIAVMFAYAAIFCAATVVMLWRQDLL